MKLVHIPSRQIVNLRDQQLPPYGVLSHTWSDREQHADTTTTDSSGSLEQLSQARRRQRLESAFRVCTDVEYLWVDFLCIDRSSSADLDEAVNGSYRRLRNARVCIAYLDDLQDETEDSDQATWASSKYWTRAWTVPELLLPPRVEFYDKNWNFRGQKSSWQLLSLLSSITKIPKEAILWESNTLDNISLASRFSWFADRTTSREEDIAYSLVAITGVSLPVRYGEGAVKAFLRLQEEILHDTRDGSILGWRSSKSDKVISGLLANSPADFRHFLGLLERPWSFDGKVYFSSRSMHIQSRVSHRSSDKILEIGRPSRLLQEQCVGIYISMHEGLWFRVHPASDIVVAQPSSSETLDFVRHVYGTMQSKILNQQRELGSRFCQRSSHEPVETISAECKPIEAGQLGQMYQPNSLENDLSADIGSCMELGESEESNSSDSGTEASHTDHGVAGKSRPQKSNGESKSRMVPQGKDNKTRIKIATSSHKSQKARKALRRRRKRRPGQDGWGPKHHHSGLGSHGRPP